MNSVKGIVLVYKVKLAYHSFIFSLFYI